jgi:hypothetical protein
MKKSHCEEDIVDVTRTVKCSACRPSRKGGRKPFARDGLHISKCNGHYIPIQNSQNTVASAIRIAVNSRAWSSSIIGGPRPASRAASSKTSIACSPIPSAFPAVVGRRTEPASARRPSPPSESRLKSCSASGWLYSAELAGLQIGDDVLGADEASSRLGLDHLNQRGRNSRNISTYA